MLAVSEWTNQALPPFHAGMGPTLLLASAGLLTAITLATYLLRRTLSFGRTLVLLSLRLLALLLIFLLIWRPTLASHDEDAIAPSQLFLLLDASESMAVADEGPSLARFQRGKDLLESGAVTDMLQKLSRDYKIETKFFQGALDVKPLDPSAAPVGKRTEMGLWLSDLLAKRGSAALRGVILLSDGIDNGKKLTLEEAGKYRGNTPLYALGLGKPTTTLFRRDIAVADIQVDPERVPVKGKMAVRGVIDALGFTNPNVDVKLEVEDRKTGTMKVMATQRNVALRKTKGNEIVLRCDAPALPGEVKVRLKVSPVDGEVNVANNEIVTYVPIEKGGVTILWVEGSPRHEAVFAMRNALAKDKRFNVFYSLKPLGAKEDPAEDFYNFGTRNYDVIVIGDISAKRFSGGNADVLQKVSQMVKRGTGLLMLGGFESLGETDWQDSAIAPLLPVELDKGQHLGQVKIEPTGVGLNYLLRLTDNPVDNKKLWDTDLPPLEGANRVGKLRPTATAIAYGISDAKEKFPILATTTIGEGRVLTFAGDTTHQVWIRPATTEGPSTVKEYQRFWKQMMLWLAHQEDSESNLKVKLDRQRVDAGVEDRLGFDVEFRGATGLPIEAPTFTAKLLTPAKEEFEVTVNKETLKSGDVQFRGLMSRIIEPGEYTLTVTGKGKDGKNDVDRTVTARFMAYAEDLESTRVAANPEYLEKIATAGGGKYFPADESKLMQILEEIAAEKGGPIRPRVDYWPPWQRQPATNSFGDQWDALWSTPTVAIMLLFVGLLTAEWVLRRKWGLV